MAVVPSLVCWGRVSLVGWDKIRARDCFLLLSIYIYIFKWAGGYAHRILYYPGGTGFKYKE